jgi:hypothetical protein
MNMALKWHHKNISNKVIILKKFWRSSNIVFNLVHLIVTIPNNLLKEPNEGKLTKKRPHVNGTTISNFFVAKDSYKKDDVYEKQLLEDLALSIVKNHLPMHLVESQWFKIFNLHLGPRVILLSKK